MLTNDPCNATATRTLNPTGHEQQLELVPAGIHNPPTFQVTPEIVAARERQALNRQAAEIQRRIRERHAAELADVRAAHAAELAAARAALADANKRLTMRSDS